MLVHLVASYNRPEAVAFQGALLEDRFDAKVIIASADDVSSLPDFEPDPRLTYVKVSGRLSVGHGRNLAAAIAFRKHGVDAVYVHVDDDITLEPEAIDGCLEALRELPMLGCVQPLSNRGFTAAKIRESGQRVYPCPLPSWAVFTPGSSIARVGYHDPDVFFRDDLDYGIRLHCAGYAPSFVDCGRRAIRETVHCDGGGFETTPLYEEHRRRRAAYLAYGNEALMLKHPWAKLSSNGTFNWQRPFKALPHAERAASVHRQPPALSDAGLDALLAGEDAARQLVMESQAMASNAFARVE